MTTTGPLRGTAPSRSEAASHTPPAGRVAGMPSPARRRRPVLVIVAVVLAALAATMVAAALNVASARTLVWATATAVSRGQPVEPDGLEPVEVAADAAAGLVPATVASRDQLAGRVWAADLPAGQLVSSALTVEQLTVADGMALVGVRLDPGGFPSAGLRPGDAVQVVASAGQQGSQQTQVLVDRGLVEAVVVLSDQGVAAPRLVTLAVPAGRAAAVAAAGTAGHVSLVMVP